MPHDRRQLTRAAAALACALALFGAAGAQPTFFEPKEHYYGAKSFGFGEGGVRWEVSRTTVVDGRDLTVVLAIGSAQYPVLNPTEVTKPDLSRVPAFADSFSIADVPDPPRKPTDKEVRFAYTLRPRNRSVKEVPALEFYYFNPRAPANKSQFRHTQAEAVSITVTEPPEPTKTPMADADHLFVIGTGPEVLRGPFVPCRWAWGAAALFGPLVAVGWFLAWRRVFPTAARLARLRHARATRRATDAIRRAGRTADPPAAVTAALLGYLRARFPLPESAVTPAEIGAALAGFEVPAEVTEEAAEVFRACDRARFAPSGDNAVSLAAAAEALIARLEALA